MSTAIVLAAGRGSRLGALTAARPKCLVTLAGRSLLDWQLAALSAAAIGEVVLIGGYRAGQLRGRGCQVIENPRWEFTNMLASLLCARAFLASRPCVVAYADIVFHPDIPRALLGAEHPVAITYDQCWASLWRERFEDPLEDAETFRLDGTRLLDIGSRAVGLAEIQGQYMGLLRFSPAGWETVEAYLATLSRDAIDGLDMTTLLGRLLARGVAVAALPVVGRWCEVDREADLGLYEARIADADAGARAWAHDWRWSREGPRP